MSASKERPQREPQVQEVFDQLAISPAPLVLEFHRAFDAPIRHLPTLPHDQDDVDARNRLAEEERDESFVALCDAANLATEHPDPDSDDVKAVLVAVARELADEVYIAYGTALAFGIDLDAVIREVHAANMRKLGKDGKPIKRPDGKVMKPKGWKGPNVQRILFGVSAVRRTRTRRSGPTSPTGW